MENEGSHMNEREANFRMFRLVAVCITIMVVFGTATCQGGEYYLKGTMARAGMSATAIRCAVDGYDGECAIDGLVRQQQGATQP